MDEVKIVWSEGDSRLECINEEKFTLECVILEVSFVLFYFVA